MNKARLEEIIRVDHAGEHGATSIYKGTLDILIYLAMKKQYQSFKKWQKVKKSMSKNLID